MIWLLINRNATEAKARVVIPRPFSLAVPGLPNDVIERYIGKEKQLLENYHINQKRESNTERRRERNETQPSSSLLVRRRRILILILLLPQPRRTSSGSGSRCSSSSSKLEHDLPRLSSIVDRRGRGRRSSGPNSRGDGAAASSWGSIGSWET